MIDADVLLKVLRQRVLVLERDLAARVAEDAGIAAVLESEYRQAKEAGRTAESWVEFRAEAVTQAAVGWVLAGVFVRFLEDNGLLDKVGRAAGSGEVVARPARYLSGVTPALLKLAEERERAFFEGRPAASERDYWLAVLEELRKLPGLGPLFDERHNRLWQITPSADKARDLLALWRKRDPESGELLYRFEDPARETRFLGDLYQDLSESARKRFALLQTPEFVEEFILERTLDPAIQEFGLDEVRLIDPACGSGHFLLGAFRRLVEGYKKAEPGASGVRPLVARALNQVYGVDINPFAAAIARFRLLVAALKEGKISRLAEAPGWSVHVATGDSLLHGDHPGSTAGAQRHLDKGNDQFSQYFATEDEEQLTSYLQQRYHVVVANPPYITVKDKNLSHLYRGYYPACSGKYSLVVPFLQRAFDLAVKPVAALREPAGYIGVICANSFMKREFAKKFIQEYVPRWDLTHVIDTSGAYIPGHGTPTVILFARHRSPVTDQVRAVMSIKGEPSTPDNPEDGQVWQAILSQIDHAESANDFVNSADLPRQWFHKHPWSLGGGGAVSLKNILETRAAKRLDEEVLAVGISAVTGEDDLFLFPGRQAATRLGVEKTKQLVTGEAIRDWQLCGSSTALWVYDLSADKVLPIESLPGIYRILWKAKAVISRRRRFGTPMLERGLKWYEWQELYVDKLKEPLSIAFAFVATHNHFVFDRGGKVFNRSAPVIKLPEGATEDDHLKLLGILNSSTACFWMKQAFFNKGSTVDQRGARQRTSAFEDFYEHDSTKLLQFPLPAKFTSGPAKELERLARERQEKSPEAFIQRSVPTRATLDMAQAHFESVSRRMVAVQDELDWEVYRLYGIIEEDCTAIHEDVPEIVPGERAFEILLARQIAAGEIETTWFERHGSTPITEIPVSWPEAYQEVVQRRLDAIARNSDLALLERPEYKRRWAREPWQDLEHRALRDWLLDRLEAPTLWSGEPTLRSIGELADQVRRDPDFVAVAALYRGAPDLPLAPLVQELALNEAIPVLPAFRYTETGLAKRHLWEDTWDKQRAEDAIDALTALPPEDSRHLPPAEAARRKADEIGDIPVPPKYASGDFRKPTYWRLRGKLDVPRERFLLYPGAEREADPTPVLGWAGWNPLEQARAIAAAYVERRDREAWPKERLAPLLAALAEQIAWLRQWHNDPDPALGQGMGDYFAGYLEGELRALGLTRDELAAQKPTAGRGRRGGRS